MSQGFRVTRAAVEDEAAMQDPDREMGAARSSLAERLEACFLLALVAAIALLLRSVPWEVAASDAGGILARPLNVERLPLALEGQSCDPDRLPLTAARPDRALVHWPSGGGLAAGCRSEITVRGGFRGQLLQPDDMLGPCEHVTYAFELHVARTVERCSDGQATLLLEFGELRGLKIVAAEPPPPIRHAPTDRPLLARLGRLRPEDGIVIVEPSHAAEILFGAQGAAVGRHALTRALAAEDSLSGKRVRATWADHEGIVAIQPLDGHLTGAELATVLQVAVPLESVVLSPAAPPAGWTADARLAALLFSPAEWQVAGGTMSFSLQPTRAGIAEPGPMIVCCGGELALESTVVPRDVGQLAAEGTIQYDPITAVIASASFRGPCRIPQPWNDGLLVQWHYRDSPVLEVFYHCRVRETTATGAS